MLRRKVLRDVRTKSAVHLFETESLQMENTLKAKQTAEKQDMAADCHTNLIRCIRSWQRVSFVSKLWIE